MLPSWITSNRWSTPELRMVLSSNSNLSRQGNWIMWKLPTGGLVTVGECVHEPGNSFLFTVQER